MFYLWSSALVQWSLLLLWSSRCFLTTTGTRTFDQGRALQSLELVAAAAQRRSSAEVFEDHQRSREAPIGKRALEDKIDRAAIEAVHLQKALGSAAKQPKVAFVFLTHKGLATQRIWEAFFADAPRDQFSIYVHESSLLEENGNTTGIDVGVPLAQFGAIRIPPVKSAWCAVFGLEVHALATALNADATNAQFVVLAESNLPVKSFSYVRDQLIVKSLKTSKVCLASAVQFSTADQEQAAHPLTKTCLLADWLRMYDPRVIKTHQWMVLSREHATTIVKSASRGLDTYREALKKSGTAEPYAGCSDEYGPLTTLLADYKQAGKSSGDTWADLKQMGVELHCTTLAVWRDCLQGTPLAISGRKTRHPGLLTKLVDRIISLFDPPEDQDNPGHPHDFEKIDYNYLKNLVTKESFLFARKFLSKTVVTSSDGTAQAIDEVLPALWTKPTDPSCEAKIWHSLDEYGQPQDQDA